MRFSEALGSSAGPAGPVPKNLAAMAVVVWPLAARLAERALLSFTPLRNLNRTALLDGLKRDCATQLSALLGKVLVLEVNIARLRGQLAGDTPEQRFASFVETYASNPRAWDQLATDYPALAALVEKRLGYWLANLRRLAERLADDWNLLFDRETQEQWTLVEIEHTLSDSHREGQGVFILRFERQDETRRWVYKPRSMAVDEHFQALLGWCNQQVRTGALRFEEDERRKLRESFPLFVPLRVIDRDDYGWSDFAAHVDCDDESAAARFYVRQGVFLALCYLLEATDFHHGNLIAWGEHPVLVDLETLFHADLSQDPQVTAQTKAEYQLSASVLRSMLLPGRMWGDDDHAGINISGLGDGAQQQTPTEVNVWVEQGTDRIHAHRDVIEVKLEKNVPTMAGRPVPVSRFARELLSGFTATMRCVVRRKEDWLREDGLLNRFADDTIRRIVRPTAIYARLLQTVTHPDHVQREEDYAAFFDVLETQGKHTKRLEALVPAEIAELRRGDVPYFSTTVASRDIVDGMGRTIVDFFDRDALSCSRERLAALDENDIDRQGHWVKAALAAADLVETPETDDWRQPLHWHADGGFESQAQACAVEIATLLARDAVEHGGEARWCGIDYVHEDKASPGVLGHDLYNGSAGIALFLGYAWKASGEDALRDVCLSAARHVREGLRDDRLGFNGGFIGWPSQIYALAHLGDIFEEPGLLTELLATILPRVPELLLQDDTMDVMYGVSGTAICLASVWQVTGMRECLVPIAHCARRLVATSDTCSPGVGWPSRYPHPLMGFSHGVAGMAAALLVSARLLEKAGWDKTEVQTFRAAGELGLAYERSQFDETTGNWPDYRHDPPRTNAIGWCHGAVSVAQGRLCCGLDLDAAAKVDVRRGVDLVLRAPPPDSMQVLCHGEMGRLLLADRAARKLGDDTLLEGVRSRAQVLLRKLADSGPVTQMRYAQAEPGLMLGLAGIGYGLLALANSSFPSVLGLDTPQRHRHASLPVNC